MRNLVEIINSNKKTKEKFDNFFKNLGVIESSLPDTQNFCFDFYIKNKDENNELSDYNKKLLAKCLQVYANSGTYGYQDKINDILYINGNEENGLRNVQIIEQINYAFSDIKNLETNNRSYEESFDILKFLPENEKALNDKQINDLVKKLVAARVMLNKSISVMEFANYDTKQFIYIANALSNGLDKETIKKDIEEDFETLKKQPKTKLFRLTEMIDNTTYDMLLNESAKDLQDKLNENEITAAPIDNLIDEFGGIATSEDELEDIGEINLDELGI